MLYMCRTVLEEYTKKKKLMTTVTNWESSLCEWGTQEGGTFTSQYILFCPNFVLYIYITH